MLTKLGLAILAGFGVYSAMPWIYVAYLRKVKQHQGLFNSWCIKNENDYTGWKISDVFEEFSIPNINSSIIAKENLFYLSKILQLLKENRKEYELEEYNYITFVDNGSNLVKLKMSNVEDRNRPRYLFVYLNESKTAVTYSRYFLSTLVTLSFLVIL